MMNHYPNETHVPFNAEPEYNLEQGSRLIAAMCRRNPEFARECAVAEAAVRSLGRGRRIRKTNNGKITVIIGAPCHSDGKE
jgi:hypothetical protein